MKKLLLIFVFSGLVSLLAAQTNSAFAQQKIIALEMEVEQLKNELYLIETSKTKQHSPEKMGCWEFKRRTRAQHFKVNEALAEQVIRQAASEKIFYDSDDPLLNQDIPGYGLPGLLINNKRGLGENVTFRITRRGFKEFAPQIYSLVPQERLWIKLPAGEYLVEISMGGRFVGYVVCLVDPANIKHADGQKCYFWAEKTLSDF